MAFPTSLYGTLQDVMECSTTQKHPLGTRLVMDDGRVFHYAKNGAAILLKGKLVCGTVVSAEHNVDLPLQDAGTTLATYLHPLVDLATTGTHVAANTYKEGWLIAHTGTGAGQVVKIKTNDLGGSTAEAAMKVYFEDGNFLSAALDTSSSKVGLCKNPYADLVVCPTYATYTVVSKPAGVPLAAIAASNYFWVQTWGPAPVLMGATPTEGEIIIEGGTSTGAAGEATILGVSTSATGAGVRLDLPHLGIVISGDADAEYALVFLMLDP
jgi:hypothetical protein